MTQATSAVQLFTHANYSGGTMSLDVGAYNLEQESDPDKVGDDTISSVKVASGYQVTVYTDADFQGQSTTFTTDTAYIGDDLNDKISSLQVTRTSPAPRTKVVTKPGAEPTTVLNPAAAWPFPAGQRP
ncbi:peptidase inhibitor family I36 protein [Nocardia sp. NPDC049149]|uniref:peptidase inhibitor family I36 protein n=1 Tax=Nocardia sp. NPDC049149 TaxID=3364315 RepID=UPI0037223795